MATPILNRPAQIPRSAQDYIAYIEDLARRNKGVGTLQAYDTSSNKPYVVEGAPARELQPYKTIMRNPVRPTEQSDIRFNGTSGDYVDATTGQRYTHQDLQSQIDSKGFGQTPPQNPQIPEQPTENNQNPIQENQPPVDDGELIDTHDSIDKVIGQAMGKGQVLGTNRARIQQPTTNPFGISPAVRDIFQPKNGMLDYYAMLNKDPEPSGMHSPQLANLRPAPAGQASIYKPPQLTDQERYEEISPELGEAYKRVQESEKRIAEIDREEQEMLRKSAPSDIKKIQDRIGAISATGEAKPKGVTDGYGRPLNLEGTNSLLTPSEDVPAAGSGITELQNIFAPLAQKAGEFAHKRIEEINPVKRIGEASAAGQAVGGQLAKAANYAKNAASPVVSNVFKAVGNTVTGIGGQSNTVNSAQSKSGSSSSGPSNNNSSSSQSKTSGGNIVKSTPTASGTASKSSPSSSVKSPSPAGQAVASPSKPPAQSAKASPAPKPAPAPAPKPASNPIATIVNIFRKLFG